MNIDIDVIQFLSAIASLIPPPAGPAIQQFLSLLSGTIDIGAGITIDYTLLAINIGMTTYMQQDFTLCPTVWTTFTFPTNVDYTVTCPDSNNIQVAAGNSSVITVRTGNDLHFDYPCFGYPTWDMGFRHHLTNDFTNHTWDSLAFYFSVTALEFWINIPSFPVMPDMCIPENCITVPVNCPEKSGNPDTCWQTVCTPEICTPAVVLQPTDWVIHIGPLFQQTWPLGYLPITWYNNTWQLAGWTPDMSGIYDTVMPNHTIIPNPSMTMSTSMANQIICFGDSTGAFTATVSNGTPPYTYTWSTGDTVTTPATSNTLSGLGAGTYYVTVSDVNGCSLMDTMSIANVDPQMFITLEPTQVTCFGGTDGQIIAHVSGGTPGYVYAWAPIGGTDSIAHNLPAGTYSVIATDLLGCPITDSTTLIELWPLPEINFTADVTEGCQPLQVQFYETTPASGQTYLWDFHDADATSTDKNPMYIFENWGSYPITIYVTSIHGCLDSLTQDSMINVYPKPVALFYPQPGVTDIVDPYIYFNNQSTFTDYSHWVFGDGETSDSLCPNHEYLDTGTYHVVLYLISEHGCRDTTNDDVIVNEVITFYAPNAFTPDNNGLNDVFVVKGSGINPATFRMMIFDRWGELVFESNDINNGWDGRVKGKIVEETTVYTWTVSYKDITRRKYRYIGTVTLIR
jgi:gliding motility-associated-like protein